MQVYQCLKAASDVVDSVVNDICRPNQRMCSSLVINASALINMARIVHYFRHGPEAQSVFVTFASAFLVKARVFLQSCEPCIDSSISPAASTKVCVLSNSGNSSRDPYSGAISHRSPWLARRSHRRPSWSQALLSLPRETPRETNGAHQPAIPRLDHICTRTSAAHQAKHIPHKSQYRLSSVSAIAASARLRLKHVPDT
jgi:hypothetical protein